jgi:hypothetical protein
MKKFKLVREVEDVYPSIWKIYYTDDIGEERNTDIKIVSSPFANCQSFSIIKVCHFVDLINLNYTNKDIIDLFCDIYNKIGKLQFVIDVREEKSNRILEVFAHITHKIYSLPYINYNGSHMILHIIQLDRMKLITE